MGTPLGPEYIPYTYMDPLGKNCNFRWRAFERRLKGTNTSVNTKLLKPSTLC